MEKVLIIHGLNGNPNGGANKVLRGRLLSILFYYEANDFS